MDRKTSAGQAIILHGHCDLTGKPCLPGIHLIQSMMQATRSIGQALPEDFRFEAEVEIGTCPRLCGLAVSAEGRAVAVSRGDQLLAEVGDPTPNYGTFRGTEPTAAALPALAGRAH